MVTKEEVIEALKGCHDPEIRVDVWTMGLIYNIDIQDGVVNIRMTLTTPACPYGPMLVDNVKDKVGEVKGVKEVKVELVFKPVWKPSDELRNVLGV